MEIYQSYSKNTKNVPYFQVHTTVQKFKKKKINKTRWGNSLVAQWLTLHASNAGGCRFNPWLEN